MFTISWMPCFISVDLLITDSSEVKWTGTVDWSPHDSLFASSGGRMGPFAAVAI